MQPTGTRHRTILKWLTRLEAAKPSLRALEIGRMRSVSEAVGHSTLFIAEHPAVAHLISIDIDPATEIVTRGQLAANTLPKMRFLNGDSGLMLKLLWLSGVRGLDYAYLDGASNARQVLWDLQLTLPLCRKGAYIILDDTDHACDVKGDLAVPYAQTHPQWCKVVEMVPRDATSQGQAVLCVE